MLTFLLTTTTSRRRASASESARGVRRSPPSGKLARHAGERDDPFATVHLGYLVDLFVSPRFAELERSLCATMPYL